MNFLNQTPITVWLPAMKVVVIALAVVFIMLAILAIAKGSEILCGLAIVFLMFSLFAAGMADACGVPSGRYKYEVTLNEGYDVKQLQEDYNIIKQRGLIYEIEDKVR